MNLRLDLETVLVTHYPTATLFCAGCDWVPEDPHGDDNANQRGHLLDELMKVVDVTSHTDRDERVKKILSKLMSEPGDWQHMLDIVARQKVQQALIDHRRELGMTQAALAERMGVSQGRVAELENDPWPDPKVSTLGRWASALGLEIAIGAYAKPEEVT